VHQEASPGTLRRLAPLLPVACALFAWAPLRHNYFKGDDFIHLYDIATKPLVRLLVLTWGGHVYTVRNTVFAAMFYVFGADPLPYFWSALLTHALNALLLYRVIRRFAGSVLLACFGATLWSASPVLEGALGWYAVYGQVLLTAVVLIVLSSLGERTVSGAVLTMRSAVYWAALLFAGSSCFGIGLGLAMAFPLVVALALPRAQLPAPSLLALIVGAVASYVFYRLVITYSPDVSPFDAQLFSVTTTLRTLPAVLTFLAGLLCFGTVALGVDFVGAHQRLPPALDVAGGLTLLLLLLTGLASAFAQVAAVGTTAHRIVLGATTLWMVVRIATLALSRFPMEADAPAVHPPQRNPVSGAGSCRPPPDRWTRSRGAGPRDPPRRRR